jgi:hypothetical protein
MGAVGRRALVGLVGALALMGVTAALGTSSASATAEVKSFSLDRSTAQAGGHPDVNIHVGFRVRLDDPTSPPGAPPGCECSDPRRVAFNFPTGFIGNPHAIPKCTLADLGLFKCPPGSQVGATKALFGQQHLYNMETRPGEPGLLASQLPLLSAPIFTVLRGRTDSDYGLTAETPDIPHIFPLIDLEINVWGVPTDPIHDIYRAPLGQQEGCGNEYPESCFASPTPAASPPFPYLQNPTSCEGPVTASVDSTYYNHEAAHAEYGWDGTMNCDLLQFNPSLSADPTTAQADSPSGIDINVKVPQTQSPTVPSASQVRSIRMTLPEGFSVNPNAADGKAVCSDAETAIGTLGPAQCPETSKVGTLNIDSSALPAPIPGAMYLGEPKPGERYRLILAASGFETHVKLAGKVSLNPQTGRIEVLFDELPQSPLQEFDLHIFGAERGLLATPERCGTYTLQAEFEPWAQILGSQSSSTSFTVHAGPDGGPCPSGSRGLDPTLIAGSSDNTAGTVSPFALKVDREDGDQNLSGLKVITPPGFLASLKSLSYCPESALSTLSSSNYAGVREQQSPACPASSLVGTAMTQAGAGSRPLNAPGKVYLAGPYKGAPVSLLVVIPAVSGPYDLGVIAVRAATHVDPTTTQITTVSDPLPQIIEGIPLRTRQILVDLNRPNFTRNPTNCDPFSVATEIFGDEGATAKPSAFYQVANCAVLPFAPKLAIKLTGSTKVTGNPALRASLQATSGESNLAKTTVTMPKSLQLDNAHIGNLCTRVQFAADACPANSVIGSAEAKTPLLDGPLEGNVYLRSSNNELPDLVADLKGQIDIELVARIDTAKSGGLRATFESLPDAPVTSFHLNLLGASKGLLTNNTNLCEAKPKATIAMLGQNGIVTRSRTKLQIACGARKSKKPKRRLYSARAVG